MASHTKKINAYLTIGMIVMILLIVFSLFIGKYPLRLSLLIAGDTLQWNVFKTLRLSRTIVGVIGGFSLGITGFVYQTVFRNPLASPDIIGVSSGASAGAAAGIVLLSSSGMITFFSFGGALLAVGMALILSALDVEKKRSTIILAGIAVHALAQTVLMTLKLLADPERELAAIEYWIMGSLNGIKWSMIGANLILDLICILLMFLLHRQIILLATDEGEAQMLGVDVRKVRLGVLLCATLSVACIISMTGLISFVGLLVPHIARLLTGKNCMKTMLLSGIIGSIFLCGADILARTVSEAELPISIFTSLIGAPFLIYLVMRRRHVL